MNNIGQINDIFNFIYPNDILIGLDDIIFNSRFTVIFRGFPSSQKWGGWKDGRWFFIENK